MKCFHTPYIICNDWMMRQLVEVCEGEKEIRMMTNSVANNGNPFGAMDYRRNRGKSLTLVYRSWSMTMAFLTMENVLRSMGV